MKIALYIDEGREQIVLTPQSEFERAVLAKLNSEERVTNVYRGGFYECQGGWTRQSANEDSTIIVLSAP